MKRRSRIARLDKQLLSSPLQKAVEKYYAEIDDAIAQVLLNPNMLAQLRLIVLTQMPTQTQRTVALEKAARGNPWRVSGFDFILREAMKLHKPKQFEQQVIKPNLRKTYERAAVFASKKILDVPVKFRLTNPYLVDRLEQRQNFTESSQKHFDNAKGIIEQQFIKQGNAPYDASFVKQIQKEMGYVTEADATRFARTETGAVANEAQFDSYANNGVKQKEWTTALFGVRPTHEAANGQRVGINELFTVGGYKASYPMDSSLPAEEVINCRCDILPIVLPGKVTPEELWTGN